MWIVTKRSPSCVQNALRYSLSLHETPFHHQTSDTGTHSPSEQRKDLQGSDVSSKHVIGKYNCSRARDVLFAGADSCAVIMCLAPKQRGRDALKQLFGSAFSILVRKEALTLQIQVYYSSSVTYGT